MVKRIIDTNFWDDALVVEKYTPEDKYFMLYLLTNPKTSSIGIYPFVKKQVAFDLGYSVDTIQFLLDRFEKNYEKIIYDQDTQEIAVKKSLKFTISKGGKPVQDMVDRELKSVKSDRLILETYIDMNKWWSISDRDIDKDIKGRFINELSKRKVSIINNNDNTNANANANTDSNNESLDESYNDSQKADKKRASESELKERFNVIWKDYPNKKGKSKAFTSYKRAVKEGTTDEEIKKGLFNYRKEIDIKGTQKQFIKHGSTWFNNKGWEDDYDHTPNQQKNFGRSNHIEVVPDWLNDDFSVKEDSPPKPTEMDEELLKERMRRVLGDG